jgi:hypothetical protein
MENRDKSIEFHPLIPGKWDDLEQLFGKKGARIIESYPFDPPAEIRSSAAYTGVAPVYIDTGFIEVMRISPYDILYILLGSSRVVCNGP